MTTSKPDRRGFLKSTAAAGIAAGAFTIVSPKQIRGSEANSRVRVACIGRGGRGTMITKLIDISELFQNLRWAMSRELGGDRIVSAGIHAIDTALLVIGFRPEKACGAVQRSRNNPINSAMDTFSLTYTFPGGVVMNYSGDQFRNFHQEIDSFSGVKAYSDGAHMQTFYGKGMTKMRAADWRYEGGEDTSLYAWGAKYNVDLFHRCVTEGNYANTTVPGAVDANLTCLLGAEAGRANSEMTWKELIENKDRVEIDMTALIQ